MSEPAVLCNVQQSEAVRYSTVASRCVEQNGWVTLYFVVLRGVKRQSGVRLGIAKRFGTVRLGTVRFSEAARLG